MMGIWDNTINSNKPVEWNANTNSTIGSAINNNVNNKPNYSAVSGAINDTVQSGSNNGFNWGTFGRNMLGKMDFGGGVQETPIYSFQATMMQPQYVSTDFQNQPSNIARRNLYNYLMR